MDRGVLRAEGPAAAFLVLATWPADWRGTWAELTVLDDMRRELEKKRRAGLSMVGRRDRARAYRHEGGRVRESKKWSSGKKRQSSSLLSSANVLHSQPELAAPYRDSDESRAREKKEDFDKRKMDRNRAEEVFGIT